MSLKTNIVDWWKYLRQILKSPQQILAQNNNLYYTIHLLWKL